MKGFRIVVLAKQVPDTRNVGKDAMKADGTVNRAVLPAIFNPEDLNALEQALRIKDKFENSNVHILTMGPGRASEIIREAMYRGADGGYLLSDRAFAGSDTLATSHAIASAIKNIPFDIIICGRQAIDGDTAQVGPQVAEKLNIPQVTYSEEVLDINDKITIKRRLDRGIEIVEAPIPLLITVNGSSASCRPRNAHLIMKYKHAKSAQEVQNSGEDYISLINKRPYLKINEWSVNDIECNHAELGLAGSPTKVKQVENVVFQVKESKNIENNDSSIEEMVKELISNHTIG